MKKQKDIKSRNIRNKKIDSGITLIALVITIIILMMLANITIGLLINSGIIDKTKLAKEKFTNAQELENKLLLDYENQINYIENTRNNDEINYKVSGTWTLTTQDSDMSYGTITDLQDNTTMIDATDNYKFIAPVDGYYIVSWLLPEGLEDQKNLYYHATYIILNGEVIGGSDRQDKSSNLRQPVNETSVLKLSARR